MKFFVAYVVDFKPHFWHDVNAQLVSHAKVEAGECEPMCYATYQQAMKVMCTIRSRKRMFLQGVYAVLDQHSLPMRYGVIRSPLANPTKARVLGQVEASKRKTKTRRNNEDVYCIRYTTMTGWRWLVKEGDWAHHSAIHTGVKSLRGFKTKLEAQSKMQALSKVTPSIKATAKVLLIVDFPETMEKVA